MRNNIICRHSKSACCTFTQKNCGLISLLFVLLIFSCKQDPLKGYVTEDGDFTYKHHIQNKSKKATIGDRVDYHLYFRREDSILASSREQGAPISLTLPEGMEDNLLLRSLTKMAEGDSLTIMRERDSVEMPLPPGYESGDLVFVDVAVLDVKSAEEVAQEKAELIAQYEASDKGYYFKKHRSNGGQLAKANDGVSFDMDLKKGDLIMFSTHENESIKHRFSEDMYEVKESPIMEILSQMSAGDSATLLIEADSISYQLDPQWGFQAGDLATFDIVVREVKTKAELDAEQRRLDGEANKINTDTRGIIKKYKAGTLETEETASGLKYHIVEKGTGEKPKEGDLVSVNYSGHLMDGKRFDNSFERGQAFPFPLGRGRVIKGWDEGVALLPVGTKAYLFIPSELGYGAQGSLPDIPENSELVFYIELLKAVSE